MPPIELIHPMLLHFPIVLIMLVTAVDALALVRGIPLGGPPANSGTYAGFSLAIILLAGLFAVATAAFGDIALDIALDRNVPAALLESHEELGSTTAWLIAGWAVLRGIAWWRGIAITSARTGAVVLVELVLCGLILGTAWLGGVLVYEHGVNVAAAMAG